MTFRDKMSSMRKVVKVWQHKKRQSDKLALQEIQKEMDDISKFLIANSLPFSMRCRLNELERNKQNILKEEA